MNAPNYNAWKWVSLSPLPLWVLWALALACVCGIFLAGWGIRFEPSKLKRAVLWALRAVAGLSVLFFLFEPGFRQLQTSRLKGRLAVLVDRSASMAFPVDSSGKTRAQEVSEYLHQVLPKIDEMKDRFNLELYGFDATLAPISLETLGKEPPRGGRTDILAAIRSLKAGGSEGTGRPLSGVLLFSDGADNVELSQGFLGRSKAELADLHAPISTFLAGREALKDLAVQRVKVDDFAFVRNSVTVEVEIRGRGFAGQSIPVLLRREGAVMAQKTVRFAGEDDLQRLSFQFTPDRTGRFAYTVEVPVYSGEVVTTNNERSFTLKVIRDRMRVLFVVGRPNWEERFLRGLLHQDANIDLVSFYILRTMSDDPNVRNQERELSLIPFPTDEIFQAKLDTFDVVIFQNFGYLDPQLSVALYERNLERYVHNGGALVVMGGDHSFGEGRTAFSTLGEVLPVDVVGLPASLESFRPRLTAEGKRHPITSLANSAAANEAIWSELPAVPGANLTRAKTGATVLLDHPGQKVDGSAAPILAVWDYGRGRSAALMVDATWYWAFPAQLNGPTHAYDRFWGNLLRWMVRDPDFTTLQVTADPPTVEPGRNVGVVVSARNTSYQPAAGAEVKVDLFSVKQQRVIGTQMGTSNKDGTVRLEFPPPEPGAYKLLGSAQLGEQSLGEGEDAVAVRAVGPELADANIRPELMSQIARATSGRAYQLPQNGLPNVPLLEPPVVEIGRSKDRPLWDRWYYLAVLTVALGAEWVLRRRSGYI